MKQSVTYIIGRSTIVDKQTTMNLFRFEDAKLNVKTIHTSKGYNTETAIDINYT